MILMILIKKILYYFDEINKFIIKHLYLIFFIITFVIIFIELFIFKININFYNYIIVLVSLIFIIILFLSFVLMIELFIKVIIFCNLWDFFKKILSTKIFII